MKTELYTIGKSDVTKALVVAVISGAIIPIIVAVQTPGFSVISASWHELGVLALNGAITGFVSYIAKNYFSNSEGQVVTPFGNLG